MNYQALRSELLNDPAQMGYQPLVAENNDAELAALLNTPGVATRTVETLVNARGLFARLGPAGGAAILEKLDAVRQSNPIVKWIFSFITEGDGIDLGHAATRASIDALGTAGVFTSEEVTALKAIADAPASRAEALFGTAVSAGDVSIALRDTV